MNIKNYVKKQFDNLNGKSEISFKYQFNDLMMSSYAYLKSNANKLFVVLNGALDRDTNDFFVYHRYSWHPLFSGHVLYISDPTLSKYGKYGLRLAWYMGDRYTPLYPCLKEFIEQVAESLNLPLNRVVFYGSSGGGFSAIQLASYLGGDSLAVSINPQTNILKYEEDKVYQFLKYTLSATMEERQILSLNYRFNAIEHVKLNNTKVLYIQNSKDNFHVKNHFEPFIKELGVTNWQKTYSIDTENSSRIQVLWYNHESGHGAELKESFPEIMNAVEYMIAKVK